VVRWLAYASYRPAVSRCRGLSRSPSMTGPRRHIPADPSVAASRLRSGDLLRDWRASQALPEHRSCGDPIRHGRSGTTPAITPKARTSSTWQLGACARRSQRRTPSWLASVITPICSGRQLRSRLIAITQAEGLRVVLWTWTPETGPQERPRGRSLERSSGASSPERLSELHDGGGDRSASVAALPTSAAGPLPPGHALSDLLRLVCKRWRLARQVCSFHRPARELQLPGPPGV
jgi:hypothetical protein